MAGNTSDVMQALAVVLIVGNVLALAAGISLFLAPRKVAKWFGFKNTHPNSVRRATKPLDVPRESEKTMLRYPRLLGAALLAGGVFVLIKGAMFIVAIDINAGARIMAQMFTATPIAGVGWELSWIAAVALLVFGALLAIVIGLFALVRVQTVKKFSNFLNRWVSTRQAVKPMARPYYGIDRLIGGHPQAWGGIIVLLAIYSLLMISWFGRVLLK